MAYACPPLTKHSVTCQHTTRFHLRPRSNFHRHNSQPQRCPTSTFRVLFQVLVLQRCPTLPFLQKTRRFCLHLLWPSVLHFFPCSCCEPLFQSPLYSCSTSTPLRNSCAPAPKSYGETPLMWRNYLKRRNCPSCDDPGPLRSVE